MVSIYEYALLAENVYNSKPISNKHWLRVDDVSSSMRQSNNFYATLYIKFRAGSACEAVIAMRGTIPARIDNDLVDIYSWFSSAVGTDWYDTLPSYFPQAIVFARKVHTYLKKYYPNLKRITYTGHSLGGALAQLVALRGRPHKAVVFNSPGCKEIAGPYYEQRKNLITSVNARYGVINKIGEPVLGNLTVIDVPNLEADAKNLLTHFHHADFIKATKLARLAELESGVLPLFINSAALSALYRIESVTDSITSIQHPLIDVITAQHSIQNLIQAIGNKQTIEVVGVAA